MVGRCTCGHMRAQHIGASGPCTVCNDCNSFTQEGFRLSHHMKAFFAFILIFIA